MSEYKINAEPRSVVGKKVKLLRQAGMTPAVLYSGGKDATLLQVNEAEMAAVFRAGGLRETIQLTLNGETIPVTVKELTRHITRGDFIHIDFMHA